MEGLVLLASAKGVWVCHVGGDSRLAMLHNLPPPAAIPQGSALPCVSWRQHHSTTSSSPHMQYAILKLGNWWHSRTEQALLSVIHSVKPFKCTDISGFPHALSYSFAALLLLVHSSAKCIIVQGCNQLWQ